MLPYGAFFLVVNIFEGLRISSEPIAMVFRPGGCVGGTLARTQAAAFGFIK